MSVTLTDISNITPMATPPSRAGDLDSITVRLRAIDRGHRQSTVVCPAISHRDLQFGIRKRPKAYPRHPFARLQPMQEPPSRKARIDRGIEAPLGRPGAAHLTNEAAEGGSAS